MKPAQHNSKRIALFTVLYFSEGAPIGFIWWSLPALLRTRDLAIEQITLLTALLVLPWTFKFLWAPLIDTLRTSRHGYRSWIMGAQLLMGASLLPLIWLDPVDHFNWWRALLLGHAFAAATQDVAIDALAINIFPAEQRGILNGSLQAGMLIGRSLFGGVALLVASNWGWHWVFISLIFCIWATTSLLFFVRESETSEATSLRDFAAQLRTAGQRRSTWYGLGFALISAAAFEAVGTLAGPYLIDRGATTETVGLFFAMPVVSATIIGGLMGGKLSDRWGRHRSIRYFLLGFVLVIMTTGLLEFSSQGQPELRTLMVLLAIMYLFIGLFTAASYALFMDITDPQLGGTQFSAFMAATNACESWSGWAGGQIVARAGYAISFITMSAVSLLGLSFLRATSKYQQQQVSGKVSSNL